MFRKEPTDFQRQFQNDTKYVNTSSKIFVPDEKYVLSRMLSRAF